jgi:hypothetical protein
MAAREHGRLRVGRTRRTFGAHSGWLQLALILTVAAALALIAHFAGIPDRLTPLVIGGCLALLTALAWGPPLDDDPRDE